MASYDETVRLWEENRYEEVLDIWKECLEQDVMKEEIDANLNEAFLQPNADEFVKALQTNYRIFLKKELPETEALRQYSYSPIRYVCYDEGKYYLYNKNERKLYGKIDLLPEKKEMQFDDILLLNPKNAWEIVECLAGGYKRKLYCLGQEVEGWTSIFYLPELCRVLEEKPMWFLDCEEEKDYFLKHTSAYVPKKIVGNADEKAVGQVMATFVEIHNKRLEEEYRGEDHILLTIGIPTYNRGNRALQNVWNCLDSAYDAEIEVLVSDNASTVQTEGYEEIRNIEDARLTYTRLPENRQFLGNIENLFAKAKGKYLLLISDEDYVIMENLSYYLALIRNSEDVGMIRSSVTGHENTIRFPTIQYTKGTEAFVGIFLNDNYMSGAIYRNDAYVSRILESIRTKYKENEAFIYYPHMFLDAIVSERYHVVKDSTYLIFTGEEEEKPRDKEAEIKAYAKLDSRLKQHQGWRELLDNLNELPTVAKVEGYAIACEKLFLLLYIVRRYYKQEWEEILRKVSECCAEEFDRIQFLSEREKEALQEELLNIIMNDYTDYLKRYSNR